MSERDEHDEHENDEYDEYAAFYQTAGELCLFAAAAVGASCAHMIHGPDFRVGDLDQIKAIDRDALARACLALWVHIVSDLSELDPEVLVDMVFQPDEGKPTTVNITADGHSILKQVLAYSPIGNKENPLAGRPEWLCESCRAILWDEEYDEEYEGN